VWPVLAVIGGTDRGLRMGGRCSSKLNMKRGTVLGVLKEESTSVKVLWDDSDAVVR
jgi:E3 ubiquitin-protein ligase HERC1